MLCPTHARSAWSQTRSLTRFAPSLTRPSTPSLTRPSPHPSTPSLTRSAPSLAPPIPPSPLRSPTHPSAPRVRRTTLTLLTLPARRSQMKHSGTSRGVSEHGRARGSPLARREWRQKVRRSNQRGRAAGGAVAQLTRHRGRPPSARSY